MPQIVADTLYRDLQLEALRVRYIAIGCRFGKEYQPNHWKIRTKGWVYTLSLESDRWQLQPENSSPIYKRLLKLTQEALQEVDSLCVKRSN